MRKAGSKPTEQAKVQPALVDENDQMFDVYVQRKRQHFMNLTPIALGQLTVRINKEIGFEEMHGIPENLTTADREEMLRQYLRKAYYIHQQQEAAKAANKPSQGDTKTEEKIMPKKDETPKKNVKPSAPAQEKVPAKKAAPVEEEAKPKKMEPLFYAPNADLVHALRGGSALAKAVDLLKRKSGATIDDLVKMRSEMGKSPDPSYFGTTWFQSFSKLTGYGVQAKAKGDGWVYFLVLPDGMSEPIAHKE